MSGRPGGMWSCKDFAEYLTSIKQEWCPPCLARVAVEAQEV